ncbi:hypothetical protein A8C56_21655 [Niabella ginsenosidivorans]|uniref:DUF4374 domain-containing protein n=1 Tax=Niabella ginsenosidivorans TaxID=1176587 RepID=A0A1A9I6J5_9BACT|nr:DUF4374 domain-containing protein [Niabella ginsenosidivorans]ANH83236.1 hypothetical protein A8C56_21655 [Niabella ginsenosidivorans]
MKKIIHYGFIALLLSWVFISCSKSDNSGTDNPEDKGTYNYVLFTNTQDLGSPGYMTAYNKMPEGDFKSTVTNSLHFQVAFGFTKFGKWIFNRSNTDGEAGIQKLTVDDKGIITDAGFLANGQMFHIVDETHGYYLDPKRSNMKIQIFNPTSMQRTGEIDLSSLAVDQSVAPYQSVGQHTIASKEGKLYVGVSYTTAQGAGYSGPVFNYVTLAVIDLATNKLEKTIKYDGLKSLGWGSSANKMWTLGDDGALYFYASGLAEGATNSAIIRIKKGETDFDKNWIFRASTIQAKNSLVMALIKNGKMYIQSPSEPITENLSNLATPIWDYYAVDINTLKATRITGMPKTRYIHSNEQGIVEIDGKIYLWMANANTKENGYYVLDAATNTATRAFNVTDAGLVSGFLKLDD